MQTNLPKHTITAVAAAAALCAPAAAMAQGGHGHGPDRAAAPQHAHGPKGPKTRTVIAKGTVVSIADNVITVGIKRTNHHGQALNGQPVQFDVTDARMRVKDANGDGSRDASDVNANDRVVVQFRVPRGAAPDTSAPFAARSFVDVGPEPAPDPGAGTGDTGDQQPQA